jgi:hypothetical protein
MPICRCHQEAATLKRFMPYVGATDLTGNGSPGYDHAFFCRVAQQVEQRLRQLEGKVLAAESAVVRGKPNAEKYDKARQGAAPALLVETKGYIADADVVLEAADGEKKVWSTWS